MFSCSHPSSFIIIFPHYVRASVSVNIELQLIRVSWQYVNCVLKLTHVRPTRSEPTEPFYILSVRVLVMGTTPANNARRRHSVLCWIWRNQPVLPVANVRARWLCVVYSNLYLYMNTMQFSVSYNAAIIHVRVATEHGKTACKPKNERRVLSRCVCLFSQRLLQFNAVIDQPIWRPQTLNGYRLCERLG